MLDEQNPLYGGCYAGGNSLPAVREEVENADFVLYVGALRSDSKWANCPSLSSLVMKAR
jgi:pyruvate decarboxylase